MSGKVVTTATGVQEFTSSRISWEMEFPGTALDGHVLLAFVGGVDSGTPQPTSATMSGSGASPLAEAPLTTAIIVTGAGGSSFPCAWVFTLANPMPLAGTATGTLTVEFDEIVGSMNAMSAVISGTNGTLDGIASISQHTQLPDFSISGTHTTTGTNTIVVDMCMSEGSNHQGHDMGENQFPFGSVFFSGPAYSTSFKDVPIAGDVGMVRTDVGGPFAGVALITIGLESE